MPSPERSLYLSATVSKILRYNLLHCSCNTRTSYNLCMVRSGFPYSNPIKLEGIIGPLPLPFEWISQVPHILQCSRQLSLFIQQLETFFQTLGFCGLCELADKVALNTNVTFVHNALLDSNEAAYLTAAYDFFLREHKCSTANEILNILHLPFPNPFQFFLVREQIVDIIDPAPYIYSLCEGDSMDSVEEEN